MSARDSLGIVLLLALGGTTCVLAIPFLTRPTVEWAELNLLLLLGSLALTLALLVHSALTTSAPRALALLLLVTGVGWLAEVMGLHSLFPFGAEYAYHPDLEPVLPGGVPLFIPLAWYVLAATALVFLRPWRVRARGRLVPRRWALKTLMAALYLAGSDLLLDPLAVSVGAWTWKAGGPYFDTPPSNYAGWFGVGLVVFALHLPWSEPVRWERAAHLDRVLGIPFVLLALLAFVAVFVRVGSGWPILASLVVLTPYWISWWRAWRRRPRAQAAATDDRAPTSSRT